MHHLGSKRKLVVETIKEEISHLVMMEFSLLEAMVTVVICTRICREPARVLTTKEETIILTDTLRLLALEVMEPDSRLSLSVSQFLQGIIQHHRETQLLIEVQHLLGIVDLLEAFRLIEGLSHLEA
jgi:hypothetical protein